MLRSKLERWRNRSKHADVHVEGKTLFRFSPAPVNNPIAITATLRSVAVMAIGQCGSWRSVPVG